MSKRVAVNPNGTFLETSPAGLKQIIANIPVITYPEQAIKMQILEKLDKTYTVIKEVFNEEFWNKLYFLFQGEDDIKELRKRVQSLFGEKIEDVLKALSNEESVHKFQDKNTKSVHTSKDSEEGKEVEKNDR